MPGQPPSNLRDELDKCAKAKEIARDRWFYTLPEDQQRDLVDTVRKIKTNQLPYTLIDVQRLLVRRGVVVSETTFRRWALLLSTEA